MRFCHNIPTTDQAVARIGARRKDVVPMRSIVRWLAALCIALTLPATDGLVVSHRVAAATAWQRLSYGGATISNSAGRPVTHIAGYSLSYPPGWPARFWPDTLAGYGQLSMWSPAGGTIDLVLLPLRPHGPRLADLIAHDAALLSQAARDQVSVPLGRAVRISGTPAGTGWASQFLYLQYHGVIYRFFITLPMGSAGSDILLRVARSLHVPPAPGTPAGIPPSSATTQPGSACCHCPAWGTGWGAALRYLDHIPIYSNAGNVDNGCNGTYGILYQCVELVQRYFALRWGYPSIWSGVEAAADMRNHHPAGIEFIPNGGSPGPREGDALLFYGGSFGHVAMVQSVDRHTGLITVAEENWSATGEASLPIYGDNTIAIRDSAYGSYTVAGWLHSPRNAAPATRAKLATSAEVLHLKLAHGWSAGPRTVAIGALGGLE
jgi:CHAP domain